MSHYLNSDLQANEILSDEEEEVNTDTKDVEGQSGKLYSRETSCII